MTEIRGQRSEVRSQKSGFSRGLTLSPLPFALCSSADAQPTKKIPRIGLLRATTPSLAAPFNRAFRQGLRDLGYEEGKNILIEYRFAEGEPARTPNLVAELVRMDVDIIVAPGMNEARAAKNATTTIPIVTVIASDPVGSRLVDSLARPGGNITGLTSISSELGGKRLEILTEAISGLSLVAVLLNPAEPGAALAAKELEAPARALGTQLQMFAVKRANDLNKAFQAMKVKQVGALFVVRGPLTNTNESQIVRLAAKNRLPTMSSRSGFVEAGGLMFYGVNDADLFRRGAIYVDKILKGAKPADLPVEQPLKFDLAINLKTAKQIGLTIPQWVLMRADKVIK
jgi:putative tryptophan/tyrosine transport system substrate-binding protein